MLIFLWYFAVMSAMVPGANAYIDRHASAVTEHMKSGRAAGFAR